MAMTIGSTMVKATSKAGTPKGSLSVIVGRNMQKRRQALGLTQSQLAEMLGVEMETVSRYERGIVAPSFPQLEKVCDVLQIQAWTLFSDGTEVPSAEGGIGELLQSLHSRDREFVVSFVKNYVEHHKPKKRGGGVS